MSIEDGVPEGMVLLKDEEWHTGTHVRLVCVSESDDIPCDWQSSLVSAGEERIVEAEWIEHRESTREVTFDERGKHTSNTSHISFAQYFRMQ